jgi:hypothetical protein
MTSTAPNPFPPERLAALRAADDRFKRRVMSSGALRAADEEVAAADAEAQYKRDRAAELIDERVRRAAEAEPTTMRTLSADELKKYVPPDPYAAGIAAMRAKEGL